jgi:hypothetical protein
MISIHIILKQVARVKSTARPMTSEELAVAGVPPTGIEIRESENIQSRVDVPVFDVVPDFGSQEEGEIGSGSKSGGEEHLSNVEADPRELIAMKSVKSYPPTFVFGESKVTTVVIQKYEENRFFPVGTARPPSGEQVPAPRSDEVVIFRDFFTCRLRFTCDPALPSFLDKFSVKMHQLTPNFYLEISKFFWIMKTFGCSFGADIFARLFELVIEKDILKLDDRKFYDAHYLCCTFNTRRQNLRKGLNRIQLAPCSKTNFAKDWSSYRFYLKVDMSKVPGYTGPAYPFCLPMLPVTAVCTASYDKYATGFESCENAFLLANTIIGGRDVIEEFVPADIWPISAGWQPASMIHLTVDWVTQQVHVPRFNLRLKEGQSLEIFIAEVEKKVDAMVGESTLNKFKAFKALVKHKRRVNRVFSEFGAETTLCSRPPGVNKKVLAVAVATCSATPPKAPRGKSSKKRKGMNEASDASSKRTKSLES